MTLHIIAHILPVPDPEAPASKYWSLCWVGDRKTKLKCWNVESSQEESWKKQVNYCCLPVFRAYSLGLVHTKAWPRPWLHPATARGLNMPWQAPGAKHTEAPAEMSDCVWLASPPLPPKLAAGRSQWIFMRFLTHSIIQQAFLARFSRHRICLNLPHSLFKWRLLTDANAKRWQQKSNVFWVLTEFWLFGL